MMLKKNKTDLRLIWTNQELDTESLTTRERASGSGLINCYIGRIGVSNAKMLQIELDKGVSIHKNYLKRFHGVEIRVLDSIGNKKDITIILSDNDLLDIFILFLEDILNGLATATSEDEVPLIVNQKTIYWSRLFARIKSDLLSKERQRGLFGELTFLNILLNRSSDFQKTIESWTGPTGSNQDFSNATSAVEVKTTKATKPSVNIASELQLDWTKLDNLFLYVIHLDEISNGVESLFRLIAQIKEKVSNRGNLLQLFEEKLDCAGIPIGEEEQYDDIGYIIRSQRAFRVQKGFPAITNDIINNDAIHNIKYQVDLTACEPYAVSEEEPIREII